MPGPHAGHNKRELHQQHHLSNKSVSGTLDQRDMGIQIKGHGRIRDQKRDGAHNLDPGRDHDRMRSRSPERGTSRTGSPFRKRGESKNSRHRERTPLKPRNTQTDHAAEGRGSHLSHEQPTPTRKRGKTREGDQKPNKKARTNTASGFPTAMDKAVTQEAKKSGDIKALTKLNEEERKAARARKYAPLPARVTTKKVVESILTSQKEVPKTTEKAKATLPKKEIEATTVPEIEAKKTTNMQPDRHSRKVTTKELPKIMEVAKATLPQWEIEATTVPENELGKTTNIKPPNHSRGMANKNSPKSIIKIPTINTVQFAPVEPNPEHKVEFVSYDSNSLPIIYSTKIEHEDPETLTPAPHTILRQNALALLREGGFKPEHLGRKSVTKSGPTRIIDDCDLYFYNGKVYVATENGLLLAADYLKLLGVPDTQPVSFQGKRPNWTKPFEAQRHLRRIDLAFEADDDTRKAGYMDLMLGQTVMIFEQVTEQTPDGPVKTAYAMRLDTFTKGWLLYSHTCRMDWGPDEPIELEPHIIDWSTYDYSRLNAISKAHEAAKAEAAKAAATAHTPQQFARTATLAPVSSKASTASTPRAPSVASSTNGSITTTPPASQKQTVDTQTTHSAVVAQKATGSSPAQSTEHSPKAPHAGCSKGKAKRPAQVSATAAGVMTPRPNDQTANTPKTREESKEDLPRGETRVAEESKDDSRHDSPQAAAGKNQFATRMDATNGTEVTEESKDLSRHDSPQSAAGKTYVVANTDATNEEEDLDADTAVAIGDVTAAAGSIAVDIVDVEIGSSAQPEAAPTPKQSSVMRDTRWDEEDEVDYSDSDL